MKQILWICLSAFCVGCLPLQTLASVAHGQQPSIAQLDAAAARAKQRVIDIVNQPIKHLQRTEDAIEFSPGWFHPGAIKPDFDNVDIRATQELPYVNDRYVTSDLNPQEMFIGDELEFNAMTKYFYVDRSLPKARLSEAEMIEINQLYKIIGQDEDANADRLRHILYSMVFVFVGIGIAAGLLLARRKGEAQT